jgi:hypothetical protein
MKPYFHQSHNADEPHPKRLTGENRATRATRDGIVFKASLRFVTSVYSVFSVVKIFISFTTIELLLE